ncbi:MAG: hypothetical protein WBA54_08030, partial [Acidaminobacteraceae bacterium]
LNDNTYICLLCEHKIEVGSVSTIRNHRYVLEEKEKQAKTLVAIMGILLKKLGLENEVDKILKSIYWII